MSKRPNFAPRCYGLASMFGADPAICGACKAHDLCMPIAQANMIEITKVIGENNVRSMHIASKMIETKELISELELNPLPKIQGVSKAKLTALIKQITNANPLAIDILNNGGNPFNASTKPAYLKPLVDVMLSEDSSRERLIRLLVTVFGHTTAQAEVLLKTTMTALDALGFNYRR